VKTNCCKIEIEAADMGNKQIYDVVPELPISGELDLYKGGYNRLIKGNHIELKSFKMTTYSDAPPGSGLALLLPWWWLY
jgi:D-glycero-alpha-D-manno-heptose-7-phosphate kinase